jgi:hypothetical protein
MRVLRGSVGSTGGRSTLRVFTSPDTRLLLRAVGLLRCRLTKRGATHGAIYIGIYIDIYLIFFVISLVYTDKIY